MSGNRTTLATMNVEHGWDDAEAARFAAIVNGRGVSAVALQEMGQADPEVALRAFPEKRWHHVELAERDPFLLDRELWDLHSSEYLRAHRSVEKISPYRGVCVGESTFRPAGTPVVHIGGHPVNGAWNGSHPNTEEERRVLWGLWWALFGATVLSYYTAGWTSILYGDWNISRAKLERLHPDQRALNRDGTIDYLDDLVHPEGAQIARISADTVNTPADHHGRLAVVRITAP